jgi:hypothetical protein
VSVAALGAWPRCAAANANANANANAAIVERSAVIAFAPAGERELANIGGLSVGMMSASQGQYSADQLLLDVSQGARVATSAYGHSRPPALALRPVGSGALVEGWPAARRRAERAPQLLRPGLLASQIPGGAGYAGITGVSDTDGVLAAEMRGRIAGVSLGSASTLLARLSALTRSHALVVADLPDGAEGRADLRWLSRERAPGELLIVVQRDQQASSGELLWTAVAGLAGAGDKELSSQSTNERGLIASFDLAPTILAHLGLTPLPPDVRGKPIETDGKLDSASLRALMARLHVIGGRRLSALGFLLGAWALMMALAAPWSSARAWALRAGALGVLWAPVAVLLPAALEPSAGVEYVAIALACMALGALTDALIAWPRALLAPALAAIVVLSVDALAGTQLLMRSLLGPNPILGARFYGIGNELKSGLAVLVLAAVAAALQPAVRGRRAAAVMAGAGVILAVVEGSARIGAGVGGVILVSFAFAVATIMLAPGALTRRRALVVLVSPVAGLVALAGIDLLTAHGGGHFTGSVLHVRSAGDLRDIIVRRYGAAWGELHNHVMPVATGLALVAGAVGLRRRVGLLAPVDGDPAWLAALSGGLAAGVVGALVEDSGPVLLVVAVFALGCVLSYLWGRPLADGDPTRLEEPARPTERYISSPGIGSIGSGP